MKSTILTAAFGIVLAGVAGAVLADGTLIITRSIADAHADLMRTYKTEGGVSAGNVRTRNEADAHADLVRDWSAKPSADVGRSIGARSQDDAYADMMRIWAPVTKVQ